MGVYQSGQMGQTVNLLTYVFGGSNPSAPTKMSEIELYYVSKFSVYSFENQLNYSLVVSGSSSFGRAIAFQAIGGGFEPRLPLQK